MRPRSLSTAVTVTGGIVCLLAAAGILVGIHAYEAHSAASARHLMAAMPSGAPPPPTAPSSTTHPATGHGANAAGTADAPVACTAPLPSRAAAGQAHMVLSIPSIGLRAPVLAGTSDAVFAQAIGHLDASKWPDQGGTDVLEAHDVTFFAHLDTVPVGTQVTLNAPCRRWEYRVTSKQVVHEGSPVANRAAPTLVMVTCWPSNALFLTPERDVVTAQLTAAGAAGPLVAPRRYTAPAPSLPHGLTARQAGPGSIGVRLGRLTVDPALGAGFAQSAQALDSSDAAVATFDTAVLAQRRNIPAW